MSTIDSSKNSFNGVLETSPDQKTAILEKGAVVSIDLSQEPIGGMEKIMGSAPLATIVLGGNIDADLPPFELLVLRPTDSTDQDFIRVAEILGHKTDDSNELLLVARRMNKLSGITDLVGVACLNEKRMIDGWFQYDEFEKLMVGSDGSIRWRSPDGKTQQKNWTPFDSTVAPEHISFSSNGRNLRVRGVSGLRSEITATSIRTV